MTRVDCVPRPFGIQHSPFGTRIQQLIYFTRFRSFLLAVPSFRLTSKPSAIGFSLKYWDLIADKRRVIGRGLIPDYAFLTAGMSSAGPPIDSKRLRPVTYRRTLCNPVRAYDRGLYHRRRVASPSVCPSRPRPDPRQAHVPAGTPAFGLSGSGLTGMVNEPTQRTPNQLERRSSALANRVGPGRLPLVPWRMMMPTGSKQAATGVAIPTASI